MSSVSSIMISIFGNKQINPDSDFVMSFMTDLKGITGLDYLPNIVNSPTLDLATGLIKQVPSITFATADGQSRVVCSNMRVDYFHAISNKDEISEKYEHGIDIIRLFMEKTIVSANRLALNAEINSILRDDSEFRKQAMQVLPFYREKTIKEWSSRVNSNAPVSINGSEEVLNVITEYNVVVDSQSANKILLCHADINTLAENHDFRFKSDSIEQFTNEARTLFEKLKSELEGML